MKKTKNYAIVTVRDDGVGIDKKHMNKLFDKLYRINSKHTHLTGGIGFGLFLAKNIVEAHRGEIIVESKPGKGSSFSVKLPLHR